MRNIVQKDKLDRQLKSFSSPGRKGIDLVKKALKEILSCQKNRTRKNINSLKTTERPRKTVFVSVQLIISTFTQKMKN